MTHLSLFLAITSLAPIGGWQLIPRIPQIPPIPHPVDAFSTFSAVSLHSLPPLPCSHRSHHSILKGTRTPITPTTPVTPTIRSIHSIFDRSDRNIYKSTTLSPLRCAASSTANDGEDKLQSNQYKQDRQSKHSKQSQHDKQSLQAKNDKRSKRILLLWIHSLSLFLAYNYYRPTIWPAFLLRIPQSIWALVHGLSAMAFAGGVITTTLLEWGLPRLMADVGRMEDSEDVEDIEDVEHMEDDGTVDDVCTDSSKLPTQTTKTSLPTQTTQIIQILRWLFQIESILVLPAVNFSLLSGVVQSNQRYGVALKYAPRHVKMALHVMLLFGAWWGVTDRRSQRVLKEGRLLKEGMEGKEEIEGGEDSMEKEGRVVMEGSVAEEGKEGKEGGLYLEAIQNEIHRRRFFNLVSCGFLVVLYSIMVLKPGLGACIQIRMKDGPLMKMI